MLTFWLRPAFALRVISRFQRLVGFDRSMALASGALTAFVSVAILSSAVLRGLGGTDAAERIISRYGLTQSGADAVRYLFAPAGDSTAGVGSFGAVFLVISSLSFARATQRLFEQTWDLKPLSVRNTRNGLWWILGLAGYLTITGWLYALLGSGHFGIGASLYEAPVTAAFLVYSGWILSAKRITWRELLPFGIIAAALTALYSVGASVYLPRLFNSYTARYGAVGAVFAMISALFGIMLIVVGSAAAGREVRDELSRIRQGLRPSEDEVRREWHGVVEHTRSRWRSARRQLSQRHTRDGDEDGRDGNGSG
ncbi:YhjD/YihY/BrkB family envelope integrity protein [Streptomyces tropicalis]|uniref:YhjD/YihY/BrkB family envelope integrity protein n=1 Tax=Streptomyces tropicalis TaxID=3034234 RepID=A0ABT6A3S6_9ACTN|nr:YhjD/YihY/BrkB family envelope integrity protein [Streptomyces tropicalis]MDF3299107.1 YhjD/YihY/BrkB family envelope integrity protein [Streptomyces tropicalis]